MTWLYENPWPVVIWGGVIEAILAVLLVKSGRGFWLFVMLGVLAVVGGLVVLERVVVTERERIEQTLDAAAEAVEHNDIAAILGYISATNGTARAQVQAELPAYKISDITLSDVQVRLNEVTVPPSATVELFGRCWIEMRRGGTERFAVPRRFTIRLRKENGRWVLTDYEHRPPIGG